MPVVRSKKLSIEAARSDEGSILEFDNAAATGPDEYVNNGPNISNLTSTFARMKVDNMIHQLSHSGSDNPFRMEVTIQKGRATDDNEMNATSLHIKYPIEDPEDYARIKLSLAHDNNGDCTLLKFEHPAMSIARSDDLVQYQMSVEMEIAEENDGNKKYELHQARWQELEGVQYNEQGEEKYKLVTSSMLRSPKDEKGEYCKLYNMYWQGRTFRSTVTDPSYLKKVFHAIPWEKTCKVDPDGEAEDFVGLRMYVSWEIPIYGNESKRVNKERVTPKKMTRMAKAKMLREEAKTKAAEEAGEETTDDVNAGA